MHSEGKTVGEIAQVMGIKAHSAYRYLEWADVGAKQNDHQPLAQRSAKSLTPTERDEARAFYAAGLSTKEIAKHFNVWPPQALNAIVVIRAGGRAKTVHPPQPSAVQLSADFFEWMAQQLLSARQELAEAKWSLANLQADFDQLNKVTVSNGLATLYAEYTRR